MYNMKTLLKASIISIMGVSSILSTEGLYAGISLGLVSLNVDLDRNLQYSGHNNSKLSTECQSGGLMLGYNYLIEPTSLMIGLELNLQNNIMQASKEEKTLTPSVNHITTVRTNNSMGGFLRIGVVINEMIIYGKMGISKANWKLRFQDKSDIDKPTETIRSVNSYGYSCGFGVDYRLNEKWSMGIDHIVSKHNPIKLSHQVGEFKMTPTINTTSLRLIYIF